jgi:PadR family transcriptional regulator, regulatory protein PadR
MPNAPMREPTYFILAVLLDGRLHGYAIIRRAEELSGGRVRVSAGTLYTALDRLLEAGFIETDGEQIVDGRLRRYYRISDTGIEAVGEEAARLAQAAAVVSHRIGLQHVTVGA